MALTVEQAQAQLASMSGKSVADINPMSAIAYANEINFGGGVGTGSALPTNLSEFAQYFSPAATTPAASATTPAGIAALPSATPLNIAVPTNLPSATPEITVPTTLPTSVADLYTQILARDPTKTGDTKGLEFWQKEIGGDGITPEEYKRFYTEALPEINVRNLYTDIFGRDPLAGQQPDTTGFNYWRGKIGSEGITPEEYKEFYAAGIPELISSAYRTVLGRDIPATDTGPSYYTEQLRSGKLTPETLRSALISGATGTDILPAQAYDILGSSGIYQSLENPQYAAALEQKFGLTPGTLTPTVKSSDLAKKNLQEIQSILQTSGFNKFQEAQRVGNIAKNFYGLTDEQETKLEQDLISGKETNPVLKDLYQSLLTGKPNQELEQRLIIDAANKAPDSPYFKANPQNLLYAKPAGEIKRGEETSYTYGADPKSGMPLIHASAFNKLLDKDGEVFIGGMQDMIDNTRHQYIGADPHSKHMGFLGRGTGALGVTASKNEIADFAKIENELNRLGGIKKQFDPETATEYEYIYLEIPDPDDPTKVMRTPVTPEMFFTKQLKDKYGYDDDQYGVGQFTRGLTTQTAYEYYKDTKAKLEDIANNVVYKDSTKVPQYKDIKEAYDDLNDKTKGIYLWQGRTDTLDPEAVKSLGIEDPKANDSHIRMYLEQKGDWLVPRYEKQVIDGKIVEKPMITPFNYSDPNLSSGFFGDLFNNFMELASTPIGSLIIGAYLGMPGGPLSGATSSLAGSLVSTGVDKVLADQLARSIISSGIGALPAGTRGFEDFVKAFGTNLAGSGVQLGASALGLPSIVSRGLGTATTAALSDRDVGDALTRLGTSEGLGTLLQNVPTGDFDRNLLAAFAPSILSGKITPTDLMRIAQATNPPPKK